MEQIETYIYEGKHFLGRGKFNSMPRVGESIFPINDKFSGTVTAIHNWNYKNELPWEGITTIYVTIDEQGKEKDKMERGK
ncbi:MAG: hypothetical protein GY757_27340 [bacterium]|nr:hypothetical protein [bacterium]